MPITPQEALQRTIEHREIFHDEMLHVVRLIMSGECSPVMMAALITGWSIFAIHRIVTWEYPVLGWRFVALRLVSALPQPILAGLLAEATLTFLPVTLGGP